MSNNQDVDSVLATVALVDIGENGLSFVVFGTVAFSIVMSLLFVATRGQDNMYDQIEQGGLTREAGPAPGTLAAAPPVPAGDGEREREIRQMLLARSERMERRGQPALDIDAELARLLAPDGGGAVEDPGLIEEVRQLVNARNERRARQGLEPLDIETEVTRTLLEMKP